MNPRTFLTVAEDLVIEAEEAQWRSAVSRAYYAAFHVARDLLAGCGFVVPQADKSHADLWLRLCNSGRPESNQVGQDLNGLRSQRNRADYDLLWTWDQQTAIDFVQMAARIIKELDDAAALPHVLVGITDTIRIYERDVLKTITWRL